MALWPQEDPAEDQDEDEALLVKADHAYLSPNYHQ